MADQVGVNSEKQVAATTNVVESGEAVTSSAQGSSSLGAAQKSMFWGQEAGPQAMGDSSAAVFNKISDVLAKEAELISIFEAEINATLKDFTGTEQDNKLQLAKIQEALARVDKSDAAAAAKAAQHECDRLLDSLGLTFAKAPVAQSSASGAAGTTQTTGGHVSQAPLQGAQPEV